MTASPLQDRLRATVLPALAPGPLGLAVSGGRDSLAMLHAFAALAPEAGWALYVASVNHGLRPEAGAEIALVAEHCADLGLSHEALQWQHAGQIHGNLMEAARAARYRLLSDWAKTRGIGRVALAHTADDQAETLLMGLARAAGLDGLTGLRPVWEQHGTYFHRPLLHVTRADLAAYLREKGLSWVDDPTNTDDRYERARVRKALATLAPLGLSSDRLARVARQLAGAQAALREVVRAAAARHAEERAGALFLDAQALAQEPAEVQRRLIQAAVQWFSGEAQPPRAEALARFAEAVHSGRAATLAGVLLRHWRGRAVLCREAARLGPPVRPGEIWDRRWKIETPPIPGQIRALGADGLRHLPDWRSLDLPRAVLIATPALWQGDALIAAPLAGHSQGVTATITAPFSLFLLSH